jgi:small GTP-binding protein
MIDRIGIVYSEFDQLMGPIPKFSLPNVSKSFGRLIAQKSIDLLSTEEITNPKALAFLPFPTEKKKGVIRCIEWEDESLRGDVGTASLSLIFDEDDDAIFYKYIKDLEIVFDEAAEKIIKLNKLDAVQDKIAIELTEIHEKFKNWLKELQEHEDGAKGDSEAFPDHDKADVTSKFSFKVVICGDAGCGKTSTVLRFTDRAFRRTYIPTIGVNVSKKEVLVDDKMVFLMLWDIAGQQKFSYIRGQFYQGAQATIILYDITRAETFNDIRHWHEDIKRTLGSRTASIGLLCGNKKDLEHARKVTAEDAQNLATELNLQYFETSALTGENIDEIFYTIAKSLAATIDK